MKHLNAILLLVVAAECANILIVYETARRSHQIWIGELAEALIKKGHNITMGGSFSKAIDASDHYHPITFEGIFLTHYKFNRTEHLKSSPTKRLYLNHEYNLAICNKTYFSKGFSSLWHYPQNFTFDLIIMDLTFGPCLYPLIQRFGKPYTIGFTPSVLTPYLAEMFGNSGYPSDFVSPLLEISAENSEPSFFDRVKNYVFTKFEIFFKRVLEKGVLEKLAGQLLNDTFNFGELEKSISLLFVNEYPLLNAARPLTPNIIPVAGMHIRKVESLPGILNSIIHNANQGLILFTSGTDIQQNIFTRETKQLFANAFMSLVQKTIIWKDNIDKDEHPFSDSPSNILIHKWLPQNDVLGHPHTKVLITTGGTMSIQEAVYHGVTVLGIPIYDEHDRNIKFIVDNKLGLKLDYQNLTEDNIYEALNTLLENPIYTQNMFDMAKKFRDQPASPLQKAVYWVEYILRHNATDGADFLNPVSRHMCSFAAYSVDVQLFLFSVISISVVIMLVFLFKLLVTLICSTCKNQRGKQNKQKQQ